MQTKKLTLTLASSALALTSLYFSACRPEEKVQVQPDSNESTTYLQDQATAERLFDDAQNQADRGNASTGNGELKTTGCGSISRSGSTLTIDFGAANCLCVDGKNRRGKIIVNTSGGGYYDSGAVRTITFDNYYVNDYKVDGTRTVSNRGTNSSGQLYYTVEVNGAITAPGGSSVTVDWDRVRTWIEGASTPLNWTDDRYAITGSGTLYASYGSTTVNISNTNPLIISPTCRWIMAGSATYTLPGGATRTINYGDSPTCDNTATITYPSGFVRTVTLSY